MVAGRRILVALVLAAGIAGGAPPPARASGWTLEPSPLQPDLFGVLAAGPSATWAFGLGAARFSGGFWTRTPTGALGGDSDLWSGTALSARFVVGVGQSPTGAHGHGMIARWDGARWRRIGVLGAVSGLRSVARVRGTARLWAVGWRGSGGTSVPLVEHRDPAGWRRIAVPATGAGILNGVATVPPNQTWAVGSAGGTALALHRTGTTWTATSLPGAAGVTLNAVAHARGTQRVIAVGSRTVSGTSHPVAYRWDGRHWHAMAIAAGSTVGELDGVVSLAPGDAWAVGSVSTRIRPLTLHWARGPAWMRVPAPEPSGSCGITLHAVAALPHAGTIWAVGDDGCGLAAILQHG